jgi:phage shock protein A
MLRIVSTLFRSARAEAEEALFDANAIRLLEQHLRDANEAFEVAKHALASVMAQEKSEERAADELGRRIATLETEARAALDAGDERRAETLAGRIAVLEDERAAHLDSAKACGRESIRIREQLDKSARRLAEVRRGLATAKATDALQRTRGRLGDRGPGSLAAVREAEATLRRIRERQQGSEELATALDTVEAELPFPGATPVTSDRPATDPKDVLARLKRGGGASSARP